MSLLRTALLAAGLVLTSAPALAHQASRPVAQRVVVVPTQLEGSERERYQAVFADLRAQNWTGAAARLDGMREGPLHNFARAMLYTAPGSPRVELGPLAWAGAALVLVGIAFEGIADLQLARFKADPGNAGRVLDTGLWRYSRHPNYFGETCVWWGYWLIASEHPWGLLTVFSPALMTWSILGMMGKELVERRMLKKRPGYEDYVRRTSGFFPWPPRR